MFERYTERARRALFFARYESSQTNVPAIEPEHLLLGLLREGTSAAGVMLAGVPRELLRHKLETELMRPGGTLATSVEIPFAGATKSILQHAAEEADALGHAHIGTEHLLLGLLAQPQTFAAGLLAENGVSLEEVRAAVAARKSPEGPPEDVQIPPRD